MEERLAARPGRWICAISIAVAGCGPTPVGQDDAGASGDDPDAWVSVDARPLGDAGACEEVIDLVFVLDTSSSMGFVLSQLEDGIGEVVGASNELAPDAHFGLIVFQDNHLLDTTGPLEAGKVHTAAETLQTRFAYYRKNFTQKDRNPGDGIGGDTMQNPICEENSLDALYAAASEFPWRDNATRIIIAATDDTFLEAPDNYGDRDGDGATDKTDWPREGDYPAAHTMAETVALLRDERIRVFSFTRLTEPGLFDGRCGTPRRHPWSAITDGWTTPYQGAAPIPEQTDARNYDVALVRNGDLSLAATVNDIVLDSYCVPPVL